MRRVAINFRTFNFFIATLAVLCMACNKDDGPTPREQEQQPEPENRAPIAEAGDDRQAEIGSVVPLDGSGSSDPDGDELTYKWSFVNLPEGSAATIIGIGNNVAEFTMDKAGDYEIQFEVSDGTTENIDSFMVSNLSPVLNQLRANTKGNLDDDSIAQRGEIMRIYGDFFSPNEGENKVTIAGLEYEVVQITVEEIKMYEDRIIVTVPEDAISGELVVTVGSQSVTWPTTIRLLENPPVEAWIDSDPSLIEGERPGGTYRDIGTVFKPLVAGQLLAVGVRSFDQNVSNSKPRITVWDMESKTKLVHIDLSVTNSNVRYRELETPLQLDAGKEYGVTFVSNDWFFYQTDPKAPFFPKTIGQIELVKHIQTGVYDEPPTGFDFPDEASLSYLTRGVDILFLPSDE